MISCYFTDTIVLRTPGQRDQFGRPGAPTDTSVRCRVERSSKMVRSDDGDTVVSSARVLCLPVNVPAGSKVVLDGHERKVISVETASDWNTRSITLNLE